MKIRMKNQIQLDGQIELIDQVYEAELIQKGGYHYLQFVNEEEERVILKFHDAELNMTRFSSPKTAMRFVKDGKALVGIPTPMGVQTFVTETHFYQVDWANQALNIHYELKSQDEERLFASYQMTISWF